MSDATRARVFLADDHPLMLYGIQKYLEERYDLVGSATEVPAAMRGHNSVPA